MMNEMRFSIVTILIICLTSSIEQVLSQTSMTIYRDNVIGLRTSQDKHLGLCPGFYPEGYLDGGQWQIRRLIGIRFNFDK